MKYTFYKTTTIDIRHIYMYNPLVMVPNRASVASPVGGKQLQWVSILIYDSWKACDFACEKRQWHALLWSSVLDEKVCYDYYDRWSGLDFVLASSGTWRRKEGFFRTWPVSSLHFYAFCTHLHLASPSYPYRSISVTLSWLQQNMFTLLLSLSFPRNVPLHFDSHPCIVDGGGFRRLPSGFRCNPFNDPCIGES